MSTLTVKKEVIAALPIVACFLVPLIQVGGIVYLYDVCIFLALWLLGFPKVNNKYFAYYDFAWKLIIAAIFFGYFSATFRAGFQVKPLQFTVQFLIGLLFARSLLLNLLAGRIELKTLARIVSSAGLVLALLAIFQFALFQLNPPLAEKIYEAYLGLSNWDTRYFDRMTGSDRTVFRVVGTWDVATTFGGMLALSSAWILFTDWPLRKRWVFVLISTVAVFMTGSRHAWVIQALILFSLPNASKRAQVVFSVVTTVTLMVVIGIFSNTLDNYASRYKALSDQINQRLDRTIESGVDDSSLQVRYVDGTNRFIKYSINNPEILLIGFGTHTENGLVERYGTSEANRMILDEDHYGFVSNGWLLIWRNWGVLGFLGLLLLHYRPWKLGAQALKLPIIVSILIIVSDNYSVHVTRCFFLLLVYMSMIWAASILRASDTETMLIQNTNN